MKKMLLLSGAFLVFSTLALAQSIQRQAVIREDGGRDQGKCTLEVYVDDSAEVQIQGASAALRTTSGQPAQWRRFECNAPMPVNPVNFRFSGVDGRGRQSLTRDPRNGGPAVVQIEDRDGGAEGYTFDLTWERADQGAFQPQGSSRQQHQSEGQTQLGSQGPDRYREYSDERYRPDYRQSEYYRRYGHGFAVDDAIEVCRQEIMRQAERRFRSTEFHIRRTDIDNGPGRNDSVLGSLDVHRGPRGERYNFACTIDFQNGRVRSAQIGPQPIRY
jgi:hypothetical protein